MRCYVYVLIPQYSQVPDVRLTANSFYLFVSVSFPNDPSRVLLATYLCSFYSLAALTQIRPDTETISGLKETRRDAEVDGTPQAGLKNDAIVPQRNDLKKKTKNSGDCQTRFNVALHCFPP